MLIIKWTLIAKLITYHRWRPELDPTEGQIPWLQKVVKLQVLKSNISALVHISGKHLWLVNIDNDTTEENDVTGENPAIVTEFWERLQYHY